jgi:hypothetical protein
MKIKTILGACLLSTVLPSMGHAAQMQYTVTLYNNETKVSEKQFAINETTTVEGFCNQYMEFCGQERTCTIKIYKDDTQVQDRTPYLKVLSELIERNYIGNNASIINHLKNIESGSYGFEFQNVGTYLLYFIQNQNLKKIIFDAVSIYDIGSLARMATAAEQYRNSIPIVWTNTVKKTPDETLIEQKPCMVTATFISPGSLGITADKAADLSRRLLITCAHGLPDYDLIEGIVNKDGQGKFIINNYKSSLRAAYTKDLGDNPPAGVDQGLVNDGRFGTHGIGVHNVIVLPGVDVALLILSTPMPGAQELQIAAGPLPKSEDLPVDFRIYGLGTGVAYFIEDIAHKTDLTDSTRQILSDETRIKI